jgi:DNA-binding NarL/FixJ family response regulator
MRISTNISTTTNPSLRVALIESDPLRSVGFLALLESEFDLELMAASLPEIVSQSNIDVVLIGDRSGQSLFDIVSHLKMVRPDLPVIVTGPSASDEIILNAIVCGAKGYVFDGAPPSDFARALRVVGKESVWVPRKVLSMFVELALTQRKRMLPGANDAITSREKEVLAMLVTGRSNKEIGKPLGITERTVKAHISKMMRKCEVQNRVELSIHAVARSLISLPAS